MESIIQDKKERNFMMISISKSTAVKLRNLGKGSYHKSINFLLNNKIDDKLSLRLNELEDGMIKMQEMIVRICRYNKLNH